MKRLLQQSALTGVAALGASITPPAAAKFSKPADAIQNREAAFTAMTWHLGIVAGVESEETPLDTKAERRISSEKERLDNAAVLMQGATARLNLAASGGSLETSRLAVGDTGKAHRAFHNTCCRKRPSLAVRLRTVASRRSHTVSGSCDGHDHRSGQDAVPVHQFVAAPGDFGAGAFALSAYELFKQSSNSRPSP